MEIVPQHSSRILQYPHERRDDSLVVLDDRFRPAVRDREQFPQLDESRESPVLLLVRESVVSLCTSTQRVSARVHRTRSVHRRERDVRDWM